MSDIENAKNITPAQLNKLSTKDLEQLLQIYIDNTSCADENYCISVLNELANREQRNPSGDYTDVDAAWASFQENYLDAGDEACALYDFGEDPEDETAHPITIDKFDTKPARVRRVRNKALLRAASIIIVFGVLFLSSSFVANAFGYDLFGLVATWTSETFSFDTQSKAPSSQSDYPAPPERTPDGIAGALTDHGVVEKLVPTWFPSGFSLLDMKTGRTSSYDYYRAIYQYEDEDRWITINVDHFKDPQYMSDKIYEKDDREVTIYEKNEIQHYIMFNLSRTVAVWNSGYFNCSISGDLSKEELIHMIDSIYE